MLLHVGDDALYQPIGSKRPHIAVRVLALRRTDSGKTRAKIGNGRGGWVDVERLTKIGHPESLTNDHEQSDGEVIAAIRRAADLMQYLDDHGWSDSEQVRADILLLRQIASRKCKES